jgi:hypothetical protein
MAEAAASVCLSLVRVGSSVTLTTPSGSADASPGRSRELLDHLAVVDGGTVPSRSADVEIVAGTGSTTVRFDGREHDFETLIDGGDADDTTAVGPAGTMTATDESEPREETDDCRRTVYR